LAEFTLSPLELVRRRLAWLKEDPEPVMGQLVRVFIDDGRRGTASRIFCTSFPRPTIVRPCWAE